MRSLHTVKIKNNIVSLFSTHTKCIAVSPVYWSRCLTLCIQCVQFMPKFQLTDLAQNIFRFSKFSILTRFSSHWDLKTIFRCYYCSYWMGWYDDFRHFLTFQWIIPYWVYAIFNLFVFLCVNWKCTWENWPLKWCHWLY